jgi:Domain of unknown function (DUF4296)
MKRLLNNTPVACCFAVFLALFFSCEKKERVPDGILTQDQMVRVLSELYITEQKISTLGIKRDSLKQVFEVMKDSIFEQTGIPDSVFKQSMDYYVDRPQTLEGIYTALIDSLNLREQRLLSSEAKK